METQGKNKNKKKKGFLSSNEPITVSVGWQIVCIPLIIAGICAIVCFTIDVVEDIRFDIACKKYSTYEMGGGYELRKYYNKPDKIVRKGRLSAVAKDIDWAKGSKEDSLWVVCKDNCCAYFNTRTGDFTSPFKYLNAWPFSEGVAAVVDEHNQLKFIDPHGNLAIDSIFRFDQKLIGSELAFHNGLCKMVDTLGRYGIIDMSGKWVVAPSSDEAFFDPQNWWVLKRNDSLMVVDTCGRTIIEMNRGQELKFLVDGSLEAWHQLYPGRIYDTAGNLIASQSYEEIQSLTYFEDDEEINTGLFVYSTDYNHKGLMTSDGQILTQAKYSDIEVLGKTRFRAELLVYHCDDCFERQSVLLNEKGQIVAE